MEYNEAVGIIQQQIQAEIQVVLNEMSPAEAQGKWIGTRTSIDLDQVKSPEAYKAVELKENGGRTTITVEEVQPSYTQRRPSRVRTYLRRTIHGVQRVERHNRERGRDTLEEQLAPKQVKKSVPVAKDQFIENAINTAIERVLVRNKRMR